MKTKPKHFLAAVVLLGLATVAFFVGKGLSSAWNKERSLQTANDVIVLQSAICNFYSEYGSLPKLGKASGTTDGPAGETLLLILLGNHASDPGYQNPRQITFLNAKVSENRDRAGLVYKDGKSGSHPQGLYDAWGMPFHFVFDEDHDGQIADPLASGNVIRGKPVVVYSSGPDKNPGGGDDIISW